MKIEITEKQKEILNKIVKLRRKTGFNRSSAIDLILRKAGMIKSLDDEAKLREIMTNIRRLELITNADGGIKMEIEITEEQNEILNQIVRKKNKKGYNKKELIQEILNNLGMIDVSEVEFKTKVKNLFD